MADRKYTATHEWVALEGRTATIGITDFAQAQLGDVVFLELPAKGATLARGVSFGVIESVKAASDLYAPAAGTVLEVNDKLTQNPELVNSDPYGGGWLIKLEVAGEPEGLLTESEYAASAAADH